MAFNYYEELDTNSKARYNQKIHLIGLRECPYKLQGGVWKNNPTSWPTVEYGDIHNYLIDSPGVYTRESTRTYKSLEAHNYFRSGWVETVYLYTVPSTGNSLLKANVKPSQRLNDQQYCPCVATSKTGQILTAHCDCMAGLAESCSHIAAVLFKIEAAVRLGYTTKACTEEPCKWNQEFVKKITPDEVSNIKFYKAARVEKATNRKNKRKHKFEPASQTEQEEFLNSLKGLKQKPVVLSCFDEYCEDFQWKKKAKPNPKIPVSLRSLYRESNKNLNDNELSEICKKELEGMKLNDDVIDFINKSTTNQSENLIWHEQRVGRITSSTVHALTHTDPENPAKYIIETICNPRKHQLRTDAINWGNEHESDALKAYKSLLTQSDQPHVNPRVNREGFKISKDNPYIGVSTDSIMTCDCHGSRIVEVKCPYSAKDKSFDAFVKNPDCYLERNQLKQSHKYYSQVQLQMYVYNVKMCDFVIWSPKFVILTFVQRDEAFIASMLAKCKKIFMSHILPELLTRKVENSALPLKCQQPTNSDKQRFCICQLPEDDREYVGCDNPGCPIEWYHLQCLKLKRKPKG